MTTQTTEGAFKRVASRSEVLSLVCCVVAIGLPSANAGLIVLTRATASYSQGGFDANQAIDSITTSTYPSLNGWAVDPNESHQTAVFETVTDVNFQTAGGQSEFKLIQDYYMLPWGELHQIGRFKLSYTTADRSVFADGLQSGGSLGDDSIWHVLSPSSYKAYNRDGIYDPGTTFAMQRDTSILVGGNNHRGYYLITAPLTASAVTGFRIDVLPDPSLPFSGPGREPVNGNFVLTEFQVSAVPIPEPSAYLAGLSALGMLGLFGWRNRK